MAVILCLGLIAAACGDSAVETTGSGEETSSNGATEAQPESPPADETKETPVPDDEVDETDDETKETPVPDDEVDETDDETKETPVPAEEDETAVPSYKVGADLYTPDPFESGQVFNVADVELLGDFTLGSPVSVDFFLRDEAVDGQWPYLAAVTGLPAGAFEAWIFQEGSGQEESTQSGNTTFFGTDPFDTFGAGPEEGFSVFCNGTVIVLGNLGADPRTLDSWGVGVYVLQEDGTTGSAGEFIGDAPSTPTLFDVDPGTGQVRSDTWETTAPVDECLNDDERLQQAIENQEGFFSPLAGQF